MKGVLISNLQELVQVPNYEDYFMNKNGELFSIKTGELKKIKYGDNGHGYWVANLSKQGKRRQYKIHQLVMLCFEGDYPEGCTDIRHLNGNKKDNRCENLKYGTRKENAEDEIKFKNSTRGTNNGMNKIDENTVILICALYKTGKFVHKQIADIFNLSRRHIGDIINKKYWKWFFTEEIENRIDKLARRLGQLDDVNKIVDEQMREENLKVEYYDSNY